MGLHVKVIHKRDVHSIEFTNSASVSDVLTRLNALCQIEGPQLLFKGREVPQHAALASLASTDSTKPIKLVLISKPAPAPPPKKHNFMDIPVLAEICSELYRHEQAVDRLDGLLEWAEVERDLAVATNEYLERTLLELDNVTGLQGEDRTAKKAAVTLVNSLCSKLDALRLRHGPWGGTDTLHSTRS